MLITLLTAAIAAADVRAVAALPGEPHIVSAAGLTKSDDAILTLENPSAFDPAVQKLRLVIVGGAGDARAGAAVLDAVRWFKKNAPASLRRQWTVSALPSPSSDAADSASLERWVTFQAPDLLVEIRDDPNASTVTAMMPEVVETAGATAAIERLMTGVRARSALHDTIARRVARDPIAIAQLLARRYPETPAISYIPALAWLKTLQLATLTGDSALADKVRAQTEPWVSGARPLFGDRILLTSVAGTMIFAELGGTARPLALEGARLATARKDDGFAEYGQGWTDDMFMSAAILARVGAWPDHRGALDAASRLLADYAGRLQRADGVFMHATDGPFAWGRGNGFAALGLAEVLTVLPDRHPARARLLAIYRRQMSGIRAHQAADGMWRQVVDEPGAYREETATAMLMTAMARGIRLGLLDRSYLPVVDRAWRALAAHVRDDGTLVDVCAGTGAGQTRQYYLERPAITGADDRGGAMALAAAIEQIELRRPSSRRRAVSSSAGPSAR